MLFKERPQQLLNEALKRENLGDIATAADLYRKIDKIYPNSSAAPDACYHLARLQQFDLHDPRNALLSYLRWEKEYSAEPLLRAVFENIAQIYQHYLHDYPQALVYYHKLLELGADPDHYLYQIADCYCELKNYAQARIELEHLISQFPASSLLDAALYRSAGLQLLEKQFESARQNWHYLIQAFPESPYRFQAELNLAKLLEEEERLQEALDSYRKLAAVKGSLLIEDKIRYLEHRIAAKNSDI